MAFGSFLNVLSFRYDPNGNVFALDNLRGRSHCPHCKKNLEWFELIPLLSFLFQWGRCRGCRHKLSYQYPIIEFISGLIFVFVPLYLNSFYKISDVLFASFEAPRFYYGLALVWILAFLILLLITLIDLKHYLIPNELNLALIVLGLVLVVILSTNYVFVPFRDSFLKHYNLLFSPFKNVILNHSLGAFVGFVFFGALSFFSRGKAMGMGDVKLALASGLLLGFADIVLTMALAFIFGGAVGALFLFRKKKNLHDKLPFAPFFVLGVTLTFFFGFEIVDGYFNLFNL
ncbi:MAG: prepilin peptidase [Patescibacteria group bacterium]